MLVIFINKYVGNENNKIQLAVPRDLQVKKERFASCGSDFD
jgi:hypothetical protein